MSDRNGFLTGAKMRRADHFRRCGRAQIERSLLKFPDAKHLPEERDRSSLVVLIHTGRNPGDGSSH